MKNALKIALLLLISNAVWAQTWQASAPNTLYSENSSNALNPILVGIGTNTPSAQLHTTGSVRFAGLTAPTGTVSGVVADANGNLFIQTGGIAVTMTCASPNPAPNTNVVPIMGSGGQLGCSMIEQNSSLTSCAGGGATHAGIGIGGPPIATTTSGVTCYDVVLGVYGTVYASGGIFIASDRNFKTNIQEIPSALSSIMKLQGVSYEYKSDEFKDMSFPQGRSLGFIAQDVEKVFPEAVMTTDKDSKAINYNAITPVLVEAIKELNSKVEENANLKAALENTNATVVALQNQINDMCTNGCAGFKSTGSNDKPANQLLQNVPNPFGQQTTIGYVINSGTSAVLVINGLDGKQLKQIPVSVNGAGSVVLNSNDLAAGTYTYTLVIDGKVADTKLMVVSTKD